MVSIWRTFRSMRDGRCRGSGRSLEARCREAPLYIQIALALASFVLLCWFMPHCWFVLPLCLHHSCLIADLFYLWRTNYCELGKSELIVIIAQCITHIKCTITAGKLMKGLRNILPYLHVAMVHLINTWQCKCSTCIICTIALVLASFMPHLLICFSCDVQNDIYCELGTSERNWLWKLLHDNHHCTCSAKHMY